MFTTTWPGNSRVTCFKVSPYKAQQVPYNKAWLHSYNSNFNRELYIDNGEMRVCELISFLAFRTAQTG